MHAITDSALEQMIESVILQQILQVYYLIVQYIYQGQDYAVIDGKLQLNHVPAG